ncbi:MAG: hypothetical protein FWH11_04125 [Micrococcales bacterium]|nr:hypothetical protein [Micrococcales bacterium]
MNADEDLRLVALDGRKPLGFLAALGVLRLVTEHLGRPARLSWSTDDCTAVLSNAFPDVDGLVQGLQDVVDSIDPDGVIPGEPSVFPPPGEAPDGLRLPRPKFRQYVDGLSSPEQDRWVASLVTDLSLDDHKPDRRADITLFAAPSGKQSMRTMLEKPLAAVRKNREVLREALIQWRRYPGVTGEYLDHQVLFDAADAPDGKSSERGVPGATWLALMSYPLMLTSAQGNDPITTCWQNFGRGNGRGLVYPLWSKPLDLAAVQMLLTHPVLKRAQPGILRSGAEPARVLSVFWIGHARRRQIRGRTFAGVLAPTDELVTVPGKSRGR